MTETKEVILSKLKDRSIVMVGMMGAGKTQVGRTLSKELQIDFVDCDQEIEKAAGSSVADIFEYYGEDAFRDVEAKVLNRLANDNETKVIATGGGAILRDETRELLLKNTLVVWLNVDVETLYERVVKSSKRETVKRPLLNHENPKQVLKDLLTQRRSIYAQAHVHVVSKKGSVRKTTQDVLKALENYLKDNNIN